MDRTTWEAFLSRLRQRGWQEGMENDPAASDASGKEAAEEVAQALLNYWRAEPTLANFAQQLNGSGVLFARKEDKKALMDELNKGYISDRQQRPPESAAQTFQELSFWRGLQSREGLAYFARLSDLFAAQAAREGVGPELAGLLQSRDLDPQMRDVRRQAVDALRKQLPQRLNGEQRSPVQRMRLLLNVMTGIGGMRLVDDGLWQQARSWVIPAAQAGEENYIALRNMLTGAMDGELLDHPREALSRMGSLLADMDKSVDCGSAMDPETMLTYWRGQGFAGISDDALIHLYQNYLQKNPQGKPLLAKDAPLLEGRNNATLDALILGDGTDPAPNGKGKGQRYAAAPADGRERRKAGGLSKGARWGAIGLGALILLLVVLILSDPDSGEKINEERQQRSREDPVVTRSSDPDPTPEQQEDTPEESPEAEQSPSPSPEEESPSPSPEEAPPSPDSEELEEIEVEGDAVGEEEALSEAQEDVQVPFEEPAGGDVPPTGDEAQPPETDGESEEGVGQTGEDEGILEGNGDAGV